MADIAGVKQSEVDAIPLASSPIDPSTPLFRVRSFRLLFITRLASNLGTQMLAVIVGWHVYQLTDSPLHLGLIGLVQVLPALPLMLVAGQVADHSNRPLVLRYCYALAFCSTAGLMLVAALPRPSIAAIYLLLLVNAGTSVFERPIIQALVPVMAPRAIMSRAIAAHVSARQLSILIGPALGGVLYAFGAVFDYGICALAFLAALLASIRMPSLPAPAGRRTASWDTLLAGFRFLGRCQPVLGAILLDVVSALFGGALALAPIYARDILGVGAWGAGVLRSAPAFGALIAVSLLARFPVRRFGGIYTYVAFAVVGVATIAFGLSDNIVLSILALMVTGGGEMLSTVVRQTLIVVLTPDEMRGRVAAFDSLFYGTSSQLGAFGAGAMAAAIGAVGAVVISGGTMLVVVMLWPWLFPALRRVDRPDEAGIL
jgi:MFS family permease